MGINNIYQSYIGRPVNGIDIYEDKRVEFTFAQASGQRKRIFTGIVKRMDTGLPYIELDLDGWKIKYPFSEVEIIRTLE